MLARIKRWLAVWARTTWNAVRSVRLPKWQVTASQMAVLAAMISAIASATSAFYAAKATQSASKAKIFEMEMATCLALEDDSRAVLRAGAEMLLDLEAYREDTFISMKHTIAVNQYLGLVDQLESHLNKLNLLTEGRSEWPAAAFSQAANEFPPRYDRSHPGFLVQQDVNTIGARYSRLDAAAPAIRKFCRREVGRFAGTS